MKQTTKPSTKTDPVILSIKPEYNIYLDDWYCGEHGLSTEEVLTLAVKYIMTDPIALDDIKEGEVYIISGQLTTQTAYKKRRQNISLPETITVMSLSEIKAAMKAHPDYQPNSPEVVNRQIRRLKQLQKRLIEGVERQCMESQSINKQLDELTNRRAHAKTKTTKAHEAT